MNKIDHTEQITLQTKGLRPRIPAWAKLEKMEISTPEVELWKLADGSGKKTAFGLRRRMKRFFQWLRQKR